MVNELWNDFRVYVKPRLGPRKYFELVVFGLLEIGSLYVTSEHITTARPLVVTPTGTPISVCQPPEMT